jgi:hypothetical protein
MSENLHKIISAAWAISFVIVVQIFATPRPSFYYLLPAVAVFLLGLSGYNIWYLKRRSKYNLWVWLRYTFFVLGWFGVFFLISGSVTRGAFLIAGVLLMYFFESLLGNPGEQLLFNEVLLTSGTVIMAIVGLSQYFLLPGVVYLSAMFVSIALITRASYEFVPHTEYVKWLCSLLIGLFITQVFWASSFLPLHYSALAIIMFNAFYLTWALFYYFLYHHLTPKKIQFHLILAGVFTVVIFLSTPWSILS